MLDINVLILNQFTGPKYNQIIRHFICFSNYYFYCFNDQFWIFIKNCISCLSRVSIMYLENVMLTWEQGYHENFTNNIILRITCNLTFSDFCFVVITIEASLLWNQFRSLQYENFIFCLFKFKNKLLCMYITL